MQTRRLWLAGVVLGLVAPLRAGETGGLAQRRTPVVEVVQRCRDAVVNISTTRTVRVRTLGRDPLDEIFNFGFSRPRSVDQKIESVGSGFIVHESGLLITNAHVVAQASDIRVLFANGRQFPAELVSIDRRHDLAVLQIQSSESMPYIHLGRSDDLMIGETVVAIGNPVGLGHTVTSGIVSALNRDISALSRDERGNNQIELNQLIQTDASINPGNSGGPLLNVNGDLIGINTAIRGDAQNIGFAIPVNRLRELLPQMLDLERQQRVRFGMRVGGDSAEVDQVRAGTPADKAGVRPRDRLVSMNGKPLRDTIDFYVRLRDHSAGEALRFDVQRDGRTLQLQVPIEPLPPPDGAKLARQYLGAGILRVPEKLLQENQVPQYAKLMVEDVVRGQLADRIGIHRGDFLIAIGQTPVRSMEELGMALEQVQSGDPVLLRGLRWATDEPWQWTVEVVLR